MHNTILHFFSSFAFFGIIWVLLTKHCNIHLSWVLAIPMRVPICPCGEAVCLSCPDWLRPLMYPRSEPSAECSVRMFLTLTYLPCLFIRGKKQTRQVFNTKFPWGHYYFYPNDKSLYTYKAKNFAIYLLLGKRLARREILKFLNGAASSIIGSNLFFKSSSLVSVCVSTGIGIIVYWSGDPAYKY